MRYYKGYIALSETCDVPVLLHVRNARALCVDQLRELLSHEMLAVIVRSLRWRVARLEKVGLVARFNEQRFLGRPVYRITQQGLECLESRGHCLVSLPSDTEQILHPSKIAHALELVNIHLAFARTGLLRSWKTDLEITSRNLVAASGAIKDYDVPLFPGRRVQGSLSRRETDSDGQDCLFSDACCGDAIVLRVGHRRKTANHGQ